MMYAAEKIERPHWFHRLEIRNQEHFDETEAFAEKVGKIEDLFEKLSRLCHGASSDKDLTMFGKRAEVRVHLLPDFAKYSFVFTVEVKYDGREAEGWVHQYNGGLIFHGSHDNGGDGSPPTFSVTMSPVDGWSIHT